MEHFIHDQKSNTTTNDDIENLIPSVEFTQLNDKQLFVYNLIKHFIENEEQLLMIVNGAGGTGKTFTIFAITKLLKKKVKRSAPTAKAAFLIKGETLHSQFRIHTTIKKDVISNLSIYLN
jgi:type I site-specific restriction endonuclease